MLTTCRIEVEKWKLYCRFSTWDTSKSWIRLQLGTKGQFLINRSLRGLGTILLTAISMARLSNEPQFMGTRQAVRQQNMYFIASVYNYFSNTFTLFLDEFCSVTFICIHLPLDILLQQSQMTSNRVQYFITVCTCIYMWATEYILYFQ